MAWMREIPARAGVSGPSMLATRSADALRRTRDDAIDVDVEVIRIVDGGHVRGAVTEEGVEALLDRLREEEDVGTLRCR